VNVLGWHYSLKSWRYRYGNYIASSISESNQVQA